MSLGEKREPAIQAAYEKYLASQDANYCAFCSIHERESNEIIRSVGSFHVITNVFPYTAWDDLRVEHHIMIIPISHIHSFNELSDADKVEFIDLVAEYENSGYSIYTRSSKNGSRTVAHLHTHLLKLGERIVVE